MNESTGPLVLYMEDDITTALLVQKRLEQGACTIDVAPDGREGMAMCAEDSYDVVLVDYIMPELNGIDVIKKLAEQDFAPPVIMLTAEGDQAVAVEALKLGARDYIIKDESGTYLELLPTVVRQVVNEHRSSLEAVRTENALAQSQAYLQNVIESSLDMIITVDENRKIVKFNATAEESLGYSREEIIGHDVKELYGCDEDADAVSEAVRNTGRFSGEITNRRKNGETFPALLSASVLPGFDGNPVGVMGISRDITEQKLVDCELKIHREHLKEMAVERTEQLKEANDRLRKEISDRKRVVKEKQKAERQLGKQRVLSARTDRLRSLGEMAAGIAHELNQPLSAVRAVAEHLLLAEERNWEMSPERVRQKLSLVVEQVDRMNHIIEHIRLFAREAGKPELRHVSVNDVVEASAGILTRQFRAHGLALETELAEDVPHVWVNPFSLEEVVLNLLANARDSVEEFLAETGSAPAVVLIRTQFDGEGQLPVKIHVVDTGMGIPAEILPRVFDPFFTTKPTDKGTGLGLAICKSIVEEFEGEIRIAPRDEHGTRVTVSLPAAPAEDDK